MYYQVLAEHIMYMNLFLPKLEFFLKKVLKRTKLCNVGFHGTLANNATEINLRVFSFSGMFYLYDT